MNAYCTRCGARLTGGAAFCTVCGASMGTAPAPADTPAAADPKELTAAAPAATAASNVPPEQTRPSPWRKILLGLLIFLLGVLVGWLLAPKCVRCPSPSGGGTTAPTGGGGTGGAGSPAKLGRGGGGGGGGGGNGGGPSSAPGSGSGGSGSAVADDGGGKGGGGGGPADISSGDSAHPPASLRNDVMKLAGGQPLEGIGHDSPPAPPDLKRTTLTAQDFTYDKTGLPRYTSNVQSVVSSLTYDKDDNGPFGSGAGIVTGDDFDKVVSWYRTQMPTGWRDQTVGDFAGMANKLRQALSLGQDDGSSQAAAPDGASAAGTGAAGAGAAGDGAAGGGPAGASPERLQLSLFTPTSAAAGAPGVMIVKKGDQPVVVMLKAHSVP